MPALDACYQPALKATPEMANAKLTIEASGACAIARDDAGFTQDVADCMASALSRSAPNGHVTWRVVAQSGVLSLGAPPSDKSTIGSVETVRMPDAFDVLDALEPAFAACPSGGVVSARVDASGAVTCTVGGSDCAAKVLRSARFPPPKRGDGVVVIPLLVQ